MMHFGEKFTDDEVEEMMAEADANNDGKIDYTEFSQMILKEINMEKSKQTPPPSIAKENNESSVQINGGKTASSSGSKNSTPLKLQNENKTWTNKKSILRSSADTNAHALKTWF